MGCNVRSNCSNCWMSVFITCPLALDSTVQLRTPHMKAYSRGRESFLPLRSDIECLTSLVISLWIDCPIQFPDRVLVYHRTDLLSSGILPSGSVRRRGFGIP